MQTVWTPYAKSQFRALERGFSSRLSFLVAFGANGGLKTRVLPAWIEAFLGTRCAAEALTQQTTRKRRPSLSVGWGRQK
jgi:hypothetical protein